MKVKIITNKGSWSCANTGKGFFIQRLIKALEETGVEVTEKHRDSADIELGIGKFVAPAYKVKKRVVRIGPSHFDTNQNWRQLNKRKAEAVRQADGVIYQSKWAQKVGRIYLGDGKIERVIFNGGPIFKGHGNKAMRDTAIMSTRKWIPQKRLKHILKIFGTKMDKGPFKLMVFGECDKKLVRKFGSDKINFRGPQPQETVQLALRHAKFMIHPVWLDACPNSVVEALSNGCPVLSSNQGGTVELINCTCGAVIQDDDWDYRPVNLLKPPPIDEDMWVNGIMSMFVGGYDRMQTQHVDIRNVAEQYIDFFEAVLDG